MFRSTARHSIESSTTRVTSSLVWAMPEIVSSAHADYRLPEPFLRIGALLFRGGEYPMLGALIDDFVGDSVEPVASLTKITDSTPQLTHEVGQHSPFFLPDAIIAGKRSLKHPCSMTAIVPLSFRISFIDTAPCCT